jgi:cytidine deaminase
MERRDLHIRYDAYGSIEQLPQQDAALLRKASEATRLAYAPYSRFRVGAAARLVDGSFMESANQENASFPAGICAERVLLSALSSAHPGVPVEVMAITYDHEGRTGGKPLAPCGICRQSLVEYEDRMGAPLKLILGGPGGEVLVFRSVKDLLPFYFSGEVLK